MSTTLEKISSASGLKATTSSKALGVRDAGKKMTSHTLGEVLHELGVDEIDDELSDSDEEDQKNVHVNARSNSAYHQSQYDQQRKLQQQKQQQEQLRSMQSKTSFSGFEENAPVIRIPSQHMMRPPSQHNLHQQPASPQHGQPPHPPQPAQPSKVILPRRLSHQEMNIPEPQTAQHNSHSSYHAQHNVSSLHPHAHYPQTPSLLPDQFQRFEEQYGYRQPSPQLPMNPQRQPSPQFPLDHHSHQPQSQQQHHYHHTNGNQQAHQHFQESPHVNQPNPQFDHQQQHFNYETDSHQQQQQHHPHYYHADAHHGHTHHHHRPAHHQAHNSDPFPMPTVTHPVTHAPVRPSHSRSNSHNSQSLSFPVTHNAHDYAPIGVASVSTSSTIPAGPSAEISKHSVVPFEENPMLLKRKPSLTSMTVGTDGRSTPSTANLTPSVSPRKAFIDPMTAVAAGVAELSSSCNGNVNASEVLKHFDPARMSEEEQVKLSLRLSKQESKYGTNMFEELQHVDASEIETLESFGFDFKDAVERIFTERNDVVVTEVIKDSVGLNEESELVSDPILAQVDQPHVKQHVRRKSVSASVSMIDNPLRLNSGQQQQQQPQTQGPTHQPLSSHSRKPSGIPAIDSIIFAAAEAEKQQLQYQQSDRFRDDATNATGTTSAGSPTIVSPQSQHAHNAASFYMLSSSGSGSGGSESTHFSGPPAATASLSVQIPSNYSYAPPNPQQMSAGKPLSRTNSFQSTSSPDPHTSSFRHASPSPSNHQQSQYSQHPHSQSPQHQQYQQQTYGAYGAQQQEDFHESPTHFQQQPQQQASPHHQHYHNQTSYYGNNNGNNSNYNNNFNGNAGQHYQMSPERPDRERPAPMLVSNSRQSSGSSHQRPPRPQSGNYNNANMNLSSNGSVGGGSTGGGAMHRTSSPSTNDPYGYPSQPVSPSHYQQQTQQYGNYNNNYGNYNPPSQHHAQQQQQHRRGNTLPMSMIQQMRSDALARLSESDQLRISMLLSKQDEVHGTNMFDSLTADDQNEVDYWLSLGYKFEKIALFVFQRKHNAQMGDSPQLA